MKRAHDIEIRWVKKAATDKANEMLKKDYDKTRDLLI